MSEPITAPSSSKIFRAAIWVAIGALIAAAIVCVVWVIVGDSAGIVGRAFLTILLLAAFAGLSILEASLASRRPAWFALASIVSWVVALIIGAFLIWMPDAGDNYGVGVERFFKYIVILLVLQGALLHIRLYVKSFTRHQTTFTSIVAYVTMGLVVILAFMLVIPLMLGEFVDFRDIYWRVLVSVAILAAVGTALVPLVNALFAPKKERPQAVGYAAQGYGAPAYAPQTAYAPQDAAPAAPVQAWPTYADGRTPLPVMPDGSPDWNAYYTGQPTYAQQPYGAGAEVPAAPPAPIPGEPAQPASPAQPAAPAQPDQPVPPMPPAPGTPDVPPPPRY
ncbi:hypothetical protein [Microbacterium oleivorans]|uniref:Uncharacterized protein n=1 Tax=Microbacterium oleivorans TaxID=273677 RepID=A0A4R5YIR5_9MICO|nr:hypothetical protein [Microbacterium oleivorans]TDL45225.1 hypothetical protein E2R54_01780 [Microbacterium oleivorans]